MTITLPPWLMAGCYALVGWSIGLRFSREIVIYAARVFPKIAAKGYCAVSRRILAISAALRLEALEPKRVVT